jgi:hypothetical protein
MFFGVEGYLREIDGIGVKGRLWVGDCRVGGEIGGGLDFTGGKGWM